MDAPNKIDEMVSKINKMLHTKENGGLRLTIGISSSQVIEIKELNEVKTTGRNGFYYKGKAICNIGGKIDEIDIFMKVVTTSNLEHAIQEAKFLALMSPEITIDVFQIGDSIVIVTKYIGNTLHDWITDWLYKYRASNKARVKYIIYALTNLLPLLAKLIQCGIVHGDIKGDNILIDSDGKLHIIDYGKAYTLEQGTCTKSVNHFGASNYRHPTDIGRNVVGHATDIFALIMYLLHMFTNKFPLYPLDTSGHITCATSNIIDIYNGCFYETYIDSIENIVNTSEKCPISLLFSTVMRLESDYSPILTHNGEILELDHSNILSIILDAIRS